ncbi:hypothetical protein HDE_00824 [Halotydeus destructor]|nr:hypothetical protein HDE_00824 [Halotydeus destructor]
MQLTRAFTVLLVAILFVSVFAEKRFGPPLNRNERHHRTGKLMNFGEKSSTSESSSTQQLMNIAQRLLEKTDWNNLYSKMFKMFLNFFMDNMMDRMFGMSLSDRADVRSTLAGGPLRSFVPIPIRRQQKAAFQANPLPVAAQLSQSLAIGQTVQRPVFTAPRV